MFAERDYAFAFYTKLSTQGDSLQFAEYLKENNSKGKNYNYLTDLGEKSCLIYYRTRPVFHESKSTVNTKGLIINIFVLICLICLLIIGYYVFLQIKKFRKYDS